MNAPPPPRGRPYWLLLVLAGLLLSPPAWAAGALIATAIAVTLLTGARALVARRRAGERPGPADGVMLGRDGRGEPVVLSDRQLSAHGLILGASGAGKSTTLLTILSDQIRRGRPVVAIDMKGSPAFARELAAAAIAAGRPFRTWTLDGEAGWNPLAHGNATELKDKLIATERFTEPHYQRAAERYVQTALQVLREGSRERSIELDDVVRLMEPARLASALGSLPRERAQQVQDYLAGLTPDQHSAIRGLGTRLAIISESHTGQYLSSRGAATPARTEIDLRRALAEGEVVLFSLNSSKYGKLAAQIGTLVTQDLITVAGHRLAASADRPQRQAMVAIDEFSALGAEQVVTLFARARESGISALVATQEMADLDRAARGFRDQVMGVTALKIAHRQDVPSSAQTIAQLAGTEKVWEETHQIGGGFGHRGYGRGSRRIAEQFVVHPNEIKSLRTGQAVVITKLPGARTQTVQIRPPQARPGPELG